jgi:hypothetical protein
MPLEISEIGVHIAVGGIAPSAPPIEHAPDGGEGAALTPAHMEQIVSNCVAQVMRNLRLREER